MGIPRQAMMRAVLVALSLSCAIADTSATSIYINNGERPARMVMGEGRGRLKFEAVGEKFEVQNRNGTLLSDVNVQHIHSADFEIMSADNLLQNWLIAGNADDVFVDTV